MNIQHYARKIALAALALFASIPSFADYPLIFQRYTADPWAIEYEGRLYVYCSHDFYEPERGYSYFMRDFTLISTDDMKNWTDHGEVFSIEDSAWGPALTWAPCVVERDGTFYLYYGNGVKGIGVATADSPLGPFRDTRDKPMIDHSTPGILEYGPDGNPIKNSPDVPGALRGSQNWGFWCFDPGVFIDDDGKAYMYFGGAHPNNARIIRLKDNLVEVDGEAFNPHIPGFFEASAMHKHNGKYYYSYSGHLYGQPCNTEYVMSDSPLGPFSHPFRAQVNPPQNDGYNNHQCFFEYMGESYIAYHNRSLAYMKGESDRRSREYMRSVAIDKVEYEDDGTIRPVKMTRDGLRQLHPFNPYKRNEAETMAKGWMVQTDKGPGESSNRIVTEIHDGDYIVIKCVDLSKGISDFSASISCQGKGGTLELRLESEQGILLSSLPFSSTGGWDKWKEFKAEAIHSENTLADLYLVFRAPAKSKSSGEEELCRIDWWTIGAKQ